MAWQGPGRWHIYMLPARRHRVLLVGCAPRKPLLRACPDSLGMQAKSAAEAAVTMVREMFPRDANANGDIYGGRILALYVAVRKGKPIEVPRLLLQSDEEKRLWHEAEALRKR